MDTACRGCLLSFTTVCCLATSDDHPPSSQLDLLSCLSLSLFLFLVISVQYCLHRNLQNIVISSPHIIRLPSQPWAAPSSFARTPRNDDADGGKRRHGGQTAGSNGRTDGDGRSHQRYATAPPRGGGAERCSRLYGHAMAAFAWLRPYVKPLISSALTLSFPPPPCHSPALRALPPPCHRSTCAEEFQSG